MNNAGLFTAFKMFKLHKEKYILIIISIVDKVILVYDIRRFLNYCLLVKSFLFIFYNYIFKTV